MAGVAMMVRDKYAVRLAQEQREELQRLIRVGKNSARVTARARILLKSDDGWADGRSFGCCPCSTVYQAALCRRRVGEGSAGPSPGQPAPEVGRPGRSPIALACSPPPEGHDHWTLRLLAGKVVELGLTPSMSHEGVRQRLKKTLSSRNSQGERGIGGCPGSYAEPYRRHPPSCWRSSPLCRPGREGLRIPAGTRNLFGEPLAGWREVAVTERRTMQDFARRMRWLAEKP